MADDNAHVRRHLIAARDHTARLMQRREAVHAAVQAHQEAHAAIINAPPSPPPTGGKP